MTRYAIKYKVTSFYCDKMWPLVWSKLKGLSYLLNTLFFFSPCVQDVTFRVTNNVVYLLKKRNACEKTRPLTTSWNESWITGSSYQFLGRVDVIENAAVLHGALHSTCPERFGDGGQRDHALCSAFGQHVALDLLPARLGHVGAVVNHKHSLVRDWKHLHPAPAQAWLPVNISMQY